MKSIPKLFTFNFLLTIILISYQLNSSQNWKHYYHLDTDFSKVIWVDSTTIASVGTNGAVLLSYDEGLNWIHDFSGTHNDLYDIAKIDSNRLIIVGLGGTMLLSYDKGKSWEAKNKITSTTLKTISFNFNQTGITAGDSGTIFKTLDGGNTWSSISLTNNNFTNFNLSLVLNDSTYLLADSNSNIFLTTNGGSNWKNYINDCYSCLPKNFAKFDNNNEINSAQ